MMSSVNRPETDRPTESQFSAPEGMGGRDHAAEIATFGIRLRQLRRSRKLSLEDLAGRTGLSAGLLSQLERGIGNPSFVTLMRLAQALDVQPGYFFPDTEGSRCIVRKARRRRIHFEMPGLTYELLTPDLSWRLEVLWAKFEPGVATAEAPYSHEGEECVWLIRGLLEAHVGDRTFLLHEGDSITFDCTVPHWYHNPGPDAAETYSAVTPASF